jgi:hypothetical protein
MNEREIEAMERALLGHLDETITSSGRKFRSAAERRTVQRRAAIAAKFAARRSSTELSSHSESSRLSSENALNGGPRKSPRSWRPVPGPRRTRTTRRSRRSELRADKAMMAENEQRMQAAGDRLAAALEEARHELESGPVAVAAIENALDIIDAALAAYRTP